MSTTVLDAATDTINGPAGAKPLTEGKQSPGMLIALWAFVIIPFAAVIAAVPVAWGWGLTWLDVVMAVTMYMIGGFGIGTGFHRYLTHGSFKAKRWLRITLAVAGSTAIEGSPTQWVADHRRHHAYSDREGDPHSPWRSCPSARAGTTCITPTPPARGTASTRVSSTPTPGSSGSSSASAGSGTSAGPSRTGCGRNASTANWHDKA